MKIGIITFHRPINYGAVLQTFALQHYLFLQGHSVEIIDYRNKKHEKHRRLVDIDKDNLFSKLFIGEIKKIFISIYYYKSKKRLRKKFDLFLKNKLFLTKDIYKSHADLVNNCQNFDAYIVGSDLVWNRDMTNGLNPVYFLMFVKGDKIKFSYASSIGNSNILQEDKSIYSEYLKNLDSISMREQTGATLLSNLTSKKITNVLDPTFLISQADWQHLEQKVGFKNYIVVYMVEMSDELIKLALKYAIDKHAKIVYFNSKNYFSKFGIRKSTSSPEDFISLIKSADYVFTNSFHGVTFSIIYKKSFYCVPHSTRSSRMVDLLNMIGLESRLVYPNCNVNFTAIDYTCSMKLLDSKISESKSYITKALDNYNLGGK